jgi:hypothetical protein
MSFALAAPFVALALAVTFTRLWATDTASRAIRELHRLGLRPGRTYKLGVAWALVAARDGRNLLWAVLSVSAWLFGLVGLHFARS